MKTFTIQAFESPLEMMQEMTRRGKIVIVEPVSNVQIIPYTWEQRDIEIAEKIDSGEYSHEDWSAYLLALQGLVDANEGQIPPLLYSAAKLLQRIDDYLVDGGPPRELVRELNLNKRRQKTENRIHLLVAATVATLRQREGKSLTVACETVADIRNLNLSMETVQNIFLEHGGKLWPQVAPHCDQPISAMLDALEQCSQIE